MAYSSLTLNEAPVFTQFLAQRITGLYKGNDLSFYTVEAKKVVLNIISEDLESKEEENSYGMENMEWENC